MAAHRFVCFARMLPEFAKLSLHDQTNLLKRSVMEMVLLRDLMAYDIENRFFGGEQFVEKCPVITVSDVKLRTPTCKSTVTTYVRGMFNIKVTPDNDTVFEEHK